MKNLPAAFCWTRFGVEAGQNAPEILRRKEAERRANNGVFLWGVGNSILPSIPALLSEEHHPKAVFSSIRSRPRPVDQAPKRVAVWTRARDIDGMPWQLPQGSLVTSHADRSLGRHYALVCRSSVPLELSCDSPSFRIDDLCNLRSSRSIGGSQVTAIVRFRSDDRSRGATCENPQYAAEMVVDLVPPYAVVLEQPIIISTVGLGNDDLISACWEARRKIPDDRAEQLCLFG